MTTFDGYDAEDIIEEAPRHAQHRDLEADLRDLIDIVSNAKQMPLSNSALVPRDEVLALLEQALHSLPDEIREARWALRDREELMAAEVKKAEQSAWTRVQRPRAARIGRGVKTEDRSPVAPPGRADHPRRSRPGAPDDRVNEAEDFIDGKPRRFRDRAGPASKEVPAHTPEAANASAPRVCPHRC